MDCLKRCWGSIVVLLGLGGDNGGDGVEMGTKNQDKATLHPSHAGSQVEFAERNTVVSGSGAMFLNVPLQQDQAYFEVEIISIDSPSSNSAPSEAIDMHAICLGVVRKPKCATAASDGARAAEFELPLKQWENAWCFSSSETTASLKDGDVLGCSFDQISGKPRVDFYLNGEKLPGSSVVGIKGEVYPGISLGNGTKIRALWHIDCEDFKYQPPRGFSGVIPSRSILG